MAEGPDPFFAAFNSTCRNVNSWKNRGTNRSGPKRCSGKVLGLIRFPSVPFLGAFSVGIARKRPRLLRISAPSSNARMICGALVYTRLAASSFWFG